MSGPIQPVAQQFRTADRPGLARQDEERGLEDVLRVVRVGQQRPADPAHHRPVPRDQRGEGCLGVIGVGLPTGGEPLQQLPIA